MLGKAKTEAIREAISDAGDFGLLVCAGMTVLALSVIALGIAMVVLTRSGESTDGH
jgi:hypothetical protein